MRSASSFLKEIAKSREVDLSEACSYLPHRYQDHRDVGWLASLIKNGFADIWLTHQGRDWKDLNERELSINLYMSGHIGLNKEYLGITLNGADFKGEKIFCSAKTDLYLSEISEKRIERWFAALLAVVAALFSAWATAQFSSP